MNAQQIIDALRPILNEVKQTTFKNSDGVSDSDAMGILIAQYFGWEPDEIALSAASAFEDANNHEMAAMLRKWAGR